MSLIGPVRSHIIKAGETTFYLGDNTEVIIKTQFKSVSILIIINSI